jgi:hypothetical protein
LGELGKYVENVMENDWEHIGIIVGTPKSNKIEFLPPSPTPKMKVIKQFHL